MELNQEQIQQINNFLNANGMYFIDVRIEMVDHIASEIENEITDINTFFEDKRLHTPFLKYMLSKKADFKKRYNLIVKRKFWSDLTYIGKDVFKQLTTPRSSIILVMVTLISVYLVMLENNNVIYFPVSLIVIYFIYYWSITRRFIKTYGNIKIVHTYSIISGLAINVIFQIHNLLNLKELNENWNLYLYYSLLISFFMFFLIGESFISRIESIKNKYQQFVL